jgi:hypothetical protein
MAFFGLGRQPSPQQGPGVETLHPQSIDKTAPGLRRVADLPRRVRGQNVPSAPVLQIVDSGAVSCPKQLSPEEPTRGHVHFQQPSTLRAGHTDSGSGEKAFTTTSEETYEILPLEDRLGVPSREPGSQDQGHLDLLNGVDGAVISIGFRLSRYTYLPRRTRYARHASEPPSYPRPIWSSRPSGTLSPVRRTTCAQ